MKLTLEELMKISETKDVKGYVICPSGLAFKTVDGELFTWVKESSSWIKPHVTCHWFKHRFVIVDF